MSTYSFLEATAWQFNHCRQPLQPAKVMVTYLGGSFNVELMACPQCGFILVPESLAVGKMLEVEQLLEDK